LAKILLWGKRLKSVGFSQFGPISEFKTAEMFYQDQLAIPRGGWCITCIAIQSAYRGKGLAKRLLSNVLLDLKRKGIKTVDAYPLRRVSSWNRVSGGPLELWQGLGFKLVLEDKSKELIIMRKKL